MRIYSIKTLTAYSNKSHNTVVSHLNNRNYEIIVMTKRSTT